MATNNDSNQPQAIEMCFWELVDKKYICVPRIQRDYAQGRKSIKASQVRKEILKSIKDALERDKRGIDLDFIYGSTRTNTERGIDEFLPLDGQQRLTTLFLLHYFFAYMCKLNGNKSPMEEFTQHMKVAEKDKEIVRFSYTTRDSSKDFCEYLIKDDLADLQEDQKPSWNIMNQSWFMPHWYEDPTVKGMLSMLDAMSEVFDDKAKYNVYFKKLTIDKYISFYVLDLEKFTLFDDLYIKMNSRGLALTAFENFKSRFERSELLNSNDMQDFEKNIDTVWTNMFWYPLVQYNDSASKKQNISSVDVQQLRFIQFVLGFDYAITEKSFDAKFKKIFKTSSSSDWLNFVSLQEDGYLIKESAQFLYKAFYTISSYWDKSANKLTEKIKPISLYQLWTDFCRLDSDLSYSKLLYLFALLLFPDSNKVPTGWWRLVRNLIENSIFNTLKEFYDAILFLHEIHNKGNFALDDQTEIESNAGVFTKQWKEEKEKYNLCTKNSQWAGVLHTAEDYTYIHGRIKFLLDSSNRDIDTFESHSANVGSLFKDKEGERRLAQLLLTQTNTDYPYFIDRIERSDLNYVKAVTYYAFNKFNDRDFGWHRYLNDDKSEVKPQERADSMLAGRKLFFELLTDPNFDSLIKPERIGISQFHWMLADCPALISYCTKSVFCVVEYKDDYEDCNTQIYLTKGTIGTQLFGQVFNKSNAVVELYTRYLYEKLPNKADWRYDEYTGDRENVYPCLVKYDGGVVTLRIYHKDDTNAFKNHFDAIENWQVVDSNGNSFMVSKSLTEMLAYVQNI